jgi:hypothetical protein
MSESNSEVNQIRDDLERDLAHAVKTKKLTLGDSVEPEDATKRAKTKTRG